MLAGQSILIFIAGTFNTIVLVLFLYSGIMMVFVDSPNFRKGGYMREYKFTKITGYVYMILGIVLYIFARSIRL